MSRDDDDVARLCCGSATWYWSRRIRWRESVHAARPGSYGLDTFGRTDGSAVGWGDWDNAGTFTYGSLGAADGDFDIQIGYQSVNEYRRRSACVGGRSPSQSSQHATYSRRREMEPAASH